MPQTAFEKTLIAAIRIAIGWVFLYNGVRQFLTPEWSAIQFLAGAKTFPGFFALFTAPAVLPVVDFLVKAGHTLIGLSLVLGVSVRASTSFAAMLMVMYYLPRVEFPYVGGVSNFIVEFHVIYALVLLYLGAVHAGRYYGLENWVAELPPVARMIRKTPALRAALS
jgi:thiosulfate dehydrogenase (quinone) large subunit